MSQAGPPTSDAPGLYRTGGADRAMLVAQITDIHLGFDPGNPHEYNRQRLDRVLARIARLDRKPDLLFATGDLIDRGDRASYERLRDALASVGCPVHLCLGNHDQRDTFSAVFPDVPTMPEGFVQYVVDTPTLRFLVLDTLEEGRHGGAFCAVRAAWLSARLAEAPARDTVIVLHHPPIQTGIDWMTTAPDEPWVERLRAAVAGHDQIVGLIAGHIHRPIVTAWAGRPLAVCASTAPQVALTLAPLDPARPDDRPMIVDGKPALALHWWTGSALVTHFDDSEDPVTLAAFDARMQPLVSGIMSERPA